MKIEIKGDGKRITLLFPTGFLFSRIGLRFIKKYGESDAFAGVTPKDLRNIKKTVKRMRRLHKDWQFVEVDSADGDRVRIKL